MNFIQEQLGRLIYPAENVSQKTDQQPIKKTPQEDPLVVSCNQIQTVAKCFIVVTNCTE